MIISDTDFGVYAGIKVDCTLCGCGWVKIRRRSRKVSDRTRAGLSFFQTRIHTDLRRFELERGREL